MEESLTFKTLLSHKGLKVLFHPRLLSVLLLGFASGLPSSLVGSTLQAWYTVSGVSLVGIGALTMVGQPYIYKFLWAPFLDRFAPPWLGRRRGWILTLQVILVAGISFMAYLNPHSMPVLLASVALFVAFSSATLDIGVDAYRADLLKPTERGLGAAMTISGYRVAMIVGSGIAFIVADHYGWRFTYLLMAALMATTIFMTFYSPVSSTENLRLTSFRSAVVEPFKEFLSRPSAIAILIFIVIYKFGDAFALSMGTPFLLRGLGFSLTDVGILYKTVGIASTIVGSFVGGFYMMKMRLYSSLLLFGLLQAISNLAFMALALVGKNYVMMVFAIFVESFCSGLGTVAFLAFLMALCDHRYTATQFALLSAFSAIGRVVIGPLAGLLVQSWGWTLFFLGSFVVSLPALFLLVYLSRKVDFNAEKIA